MTKFIFLAVAIAVICFLISFASCISIICRVHKSRKETSLSEDKEKTGVTAAVITNFETSQGGNHSLNNRPNHDIEMGTAPQISNRNELENSFESYDGEDEGIGQSVGLPLESTAVDSYKQDLMDQLSQTPAHVMGTQGIEYQNHTRNAAYGGSYERQQHTYGNRGVHNDDQEGTTYDYCYYQSEDLHQQQVADN